MAGTGVARDFGWFRYTANDGATHYAVKTDKNWGAAAASGFSAFNATDPVFPGGARNRPRKVVLQDTVSGRTTTRPVGSSAATILVRGATTTENVAGVTGLVTLTSLGELPERFAKSHAIVSKPEPIAV